jgi:hypothetical protein
MARPRVVRTDHGRAKERLGPVQELRFGQLKAFLRQLNDPEVQDEAKRDDHLFASIIDLATDEYGVRQTSIADAIGISGAAVGRWAKGTNLPAPYVRASVIQALAAIIQEDVQKQTVEKPLLPRGRVTH